LILFSTYDLGNIERKSQSIHVDDSEVNHTPHLDLNLGKPRKRLNSGWLHIVRLSLITDFSQAMIATYIEAIQVMLSTKQSWLIIENMKQKQPLKYY
jgi:hypothetical protein